MTFAHLFTKEAQLYMRLCFSHLSGKRNRRHAQSPSGPYGVPQTCLSRIHPQWLGRFDVLIFLDDVSTGDCHFSLILQGALCANRLQ
jgi:hypothetical protein